MPAYDALIQAESGWASVTGAPTDPPVKSGLSLVDYIGGLTAALGLLSKVIDAQRSGRGGDVDVDLYRSALSMYAYQATWMLTRGTPLERAAMSAHASIVPFQFFQTADGHLAIACAKEKFFTELIDALDLPQVADDPAFARFADRRQHRDQLLILLASVFRSKPTDHWLELLTGRVPVAPVRSMAQALDLAELRQLGMLAEYDSTDFGTVRSVGSPISVGGYHHRYSAAPGLGADEQSLLLEIGLDSAAAASLAERGAFGRQKETRGVLS